jgi:TRAP-type C4-dicarboxylate transport system permease large subunit
VFRSARLHALTTLGVLVALLVTLVIGMGPNVATRAVSVGDAIWPGYAELRTDPVAPDCDLDALTRRVAECPAAAPAAEASDAPFDPFAEAPAAFDPFAEGAGGPAVDCGALAGLRDQCAAQRTAYDALAARITPGVRAFRAFEQYAAAFGAFPGWRHLLVVLTVIGGLATTLLREHLALRDAHTLREHRFQQGGQLLVHLALAASCLVDWRIQAGAAAGAEGMGTALLWGLGFLSWAGVNAALLVRPPGGLADAPSPWWRFMAVTSLHTWMGATAAIWFHVVERHPSGPAIYLHKFEQTPTIYLGVGLYIWAGMLLAHTRIAPRVFDVLEPWKLPIHLLVWLVVVLSAFPTAYSGASGIFVIAAGNVIYHRLRAAGAHPRLAIGATAMSGSFGVVLRPCLVVLLIAALNKQVTTDELFAWGRWVFVLTSSLLLIALLVYGRFRVSLAPVGDAFPASLRASGRLVPYVLVSAAMLAVYGFGLGTHVTEFTAPYILPGVLIALLVWDRRDAHGADPSEPRPWPALVGATHASTTNVGALLAVMFASVAFGGVVERSEIMDAVPADLGGPFVAMTLLILVKVILGMVMDALGAVVLVSISMARVALDNGIDPVHFWMMVMVGFELGYLTPPLGLNHLLARRVVGAEVAALDEPAPTWFGRNEHLILPFGVMATALLLVGYVPLFFY